MKKAPVELTPNENTRARKRKTLRKTHRPTWSLCRKQHRYLPMGSAKCSTLYHICWPFNANIHKRYEKYTNKCTPHPIRDGNTEQNGKIHTRHPSKKHLSNKTIWRFESTQSNRISKLNYINLADDANIDIIKINEIPPIIYLRTLIWRSKLWNKSGRDKHTTE